MFTELKRWRISDLNRYVRDRLEEDYRLQELEAEGEVSNFRVPGSGHAYFTLKDASAAIRCVMFGFTREHAGPKPKDGDQVVVRGRVTLYEAGGDYQIICDRIRPAGIGDLYTQFERLKAKLYAEGLFDTADKLPIPERPAVIGVVTSPSTAALQDVLNVINRRNPLARVILSPALVQGEGAPPQIMAALRLLEQLAQPPDVILLVRGGGSMEDLWCFNDEALARAVADLTARVPVVSGVGHEIDTTLVDFAASLRAPTPSAAAELVTPVTIDDLRYVLEVASVRLNGAYAGILDAGRQELAWARLNLLRHSPRARVDSARQMIDSLEARLEQATRTGL
ncbi:MAG: exodeoxyribonuclease VII large subunit, partial [Anaerolineae bacterium]|nr:exodeoxyribonuclease VII large subunit [Anaerolineae bacterium]